MDPAFGWIQVIREICFASFCSLANYYKNAAGAVRASI